MAKGYEWKAHKRGNLSDDYAYENMLNFTSKQGNTNTVEIS